MGEFVADFRQNWDNSYWWADHQLLMAAIIAVIGLVVHGVHLLMDRKWGTPDA